MSDPILIVSSQKVTKHEISVLISRLGGKLEESGPFIGSIQTDGGAIWIADNTSELSFLIQTHAHVIKLKLNEEAKSSVIIETLRNAESRKIAYDFCFQATREWNALCSDGSGGFLTAAEMSAFTEGGKDLSFIG